jgi:hypothetical protein
MPDVRFEQFYRDTATLAWPAADAIERRGRQRRRRQRIVAALGAATVLVGAVAAGAAVRGGGSGPEPVPPASQPAVSPSATGNPSAGPSATGSPSGPPATSGPPSSQQAPLTEVPPTAMLRPADIGAGNWTVSEEADGDWTVYFVLSLCTVPMGPDGTDLDTRDRTLSQGGRSVAQRVRVFAPGDSAVSLAALRAKVAACGTFRARYTGDEITVRIVRTGSVPGADESFLVETRTAGGVGWSVFVRKGALVSELLVTPNTEDESLRIGRAAATRLTQVAG